MRILQEYKFLMIIIVLSLTSIATFFLSISENAKFNDYLTEYKFNYSRIKKFELLKKQYMMFFQLIEKI